LHNAYGLQYFSNFIRYLDSRLLTRYLRPILVTSVFWYLGCMKGDAFAEHRGQELKLFFCEIHFKTSSRAIEGCLMELELTDSEATLLGWPPELLDD